MSKKDRNLGENTHGGGIDEAEIDRFSSLAENWWDSEGPMRPLHRLNPVRIAYIRDAAIARFGAGGDPGGLRPLENLSILDIGCGAGLLSEPLARLGAKVTGIDPAERNIEVARLHAEASGLGIDYRAADAETLVAEKRTFDVVLAMEVIEHTTSPDLFLGACADLVRPGGLFVLSTLNRTPQSFLKAVVGAEYLLGWLPRGTHRWSRFIAPSKVARMLRWSGLRVCDVTGVAWRAADDTFVTTRDRDVNYMLQAVKD